MKYRGIALIQVLVLCAILSTFALYVSKSTRDQVEMASWANDKAQAELLLHSGYSELLFTLFTYERARLSVSDGGNAITAQWNFFDHPFQLSENITVKIQDLAGKIGLHYLDSSRLERLLLAQGISYQRVSLIIARLLDWQDIDNIPRPNGFEGNGVINVRNGYITDLTDLEMLIDLTPIEKAVLYRNLTIYYNGSFNPLTASKELLIAEVGEASTQQLLELRLRRDISPLEYRKITGTKIDIDTHLYPSTSLKIELTANVGQSTVTKSYIISLKRYVKERLEPINTLFEKG
ncbi:type II secretion system protein GspK [Pseudoalteromonas aurantia]|uniref:type II secretion system protein GspK n=1 Tax=Pseudoalteromonas aurantia TaxID=43654 RepID=UPI001787E974|nr:type II secretion system protein GspK [Pseudoalteromonas aurantia]